ncbi:MurR/RpiR family transcriptional regulator [Streptomyces somaliensis]|uniref:MurR/RpiR family transcriptional regulator n=1 Tax=Streptomyces somaliensis (strain ATCC 33201 / DSM 40738 / JCM 12659 / KCTC 9044 / NCTC 11332 / NRRL B-12077 / IP 733) TaxID=1134445 RepID=A0AA44DHE1_STRE0|nr:MurR/RpiR family transcriptional regulator [Streptomyces somaliensis]MCP9946992.1 MurR/RpiR family transcriptional regulator [Streptomyces somaliensis]MCP9963629.1 MurR/RpiR family transcriptional regulator [Streptomyces somaliensis]MCP9972845.1 MurR/RpiR family transcriptional regulator [Streptomyces somaliensis]MCP9976047.1 MurR/RpiR family transcriptional regulator [Streptomyces somaliensis]MCQ0021616.1 MurR/RpiR family transcriptional regulator [Streptomyces somaliensis DSM 40738]
MPSGQQARAQAAAITPGRRAPESEPGPAERVRALFTGHRLSPAQRRIAQYLVDHLTEAAFLSITDLAERVGVSQPSVTRFATSLGYSGFPALREALQPIALSAVAGVAESREEIRSNELQAAVDAEIQNLEGLRRVLADPGQVLEVGRRLARSVPLTVLGLRISASLAEYFAYAARRIHPDVRVVTRGGSVAYDALLQAWEAGGSWALAYAMPRHANETLAAVRAARRTGLRVALISDLTMGPLVEEADAALTAPVGSRLVFDSYSAPGVLSAAVLQAMADAEPERTQARLERYEQVALQRDFFVGD